MKRALVVFLLLAVAAIVPAAAKDKKKDKDQKSDTSHEVSYYNFSETAGNITLMVYSYPAHWRTKEKCIPLWITVAMGSGKEAKHPIELTLENFELTDAEGNSYPTIASSELQSIYKEQMSDQNIMRERPVSYGNMFDTYEQVEGALYPAARNMRLSGNTIELNPFTMFASMMYFPQPKAGLKGVLSMRLQGEGIETPVEVKFKIP